jgi:hypothetical protein
MSERVRAKAGIASSSYGFSRALPLSFGSLGEERDEAHGSDAFRNDGH